MEITVTLLKENVELIIELIEMEQYDNEKNAIEEVPQSRTDQLETVRSLLASKIK